MDSLERQIRQMEDSLEKLQEKTRDSEVKLADSKKHAAKAKKYEAVYERDRAIQAIIDKYPEDKMLEQQDKEKLQASIQGVLQHIAKVGVLLIQFSRNRFLSSAFWLKK